MYIEFLLVKDLSSDLSFQGSVENIVKNLFMSWGFYFFIFYVFLKSIRTVSS